MALSYHTIANTEMSGNRYLVPSEEIPQEKRQGQMLPYLLQQNLIDAPSACIRREALLGAQGVGVFDTIIPNLEDYELVLRIAQKYRIGYVDEVLVEKYEMRDGVNLNLRKGLVSHCIIVGKFKEDLVKYGLYELKLQALRQFGEKNNISDWMEENIRKFCRENEE